MISLIELPIDLTNLLAQLLVVFEFETNDLLRRHPQHTLYLRFLSIVTSHFLAFSYWVQLRRGPKCREANHHDRRHISGELSG